jgi:hypothetical protein
LYNSLGTHVVIATAFILSPKDGGVVSPCLFILVTVEQQKSGNSDSSTSRVLHPHRVRLSQASCVNTILVNHSMSIVNHRRPRRSGRRNKPRPHLSHDIESTGRKQDLERSLEEFERAHNIYPLDHPCRAAAESNLAMAKFILYQVEDTDASVEVPLSFCRNVLATHPVGHVDRPSTSIQLAAMHFTRFQKQREEVERARAEVFLNETIELSSIESHEHRVATFMLQIHTGMGPAQRDGRFPMEVNSAGRLRSS